MNKARDWKDQLGEPAISVAGLQIWIHSRQFGGTQDYSNVDWLNVTAHCGGKGADVWVSGSIVQLGDIRGWLKGCQRLHKTLRGEALLRPAEPELSVLLSATNGKGKMQMQVDISPALAEQQHTFTFDIDQSYLPALISQCEKLLAEFRCGDRRERQRDA
jgi:hypothetical protein